MTPLGHKLLFLILLLLSAQTRGDGTAVTQIYSPYVQPLEKELEFVWIHDERRQGHTPPRVVVNLAMEPLFFPTYTLSSVLPI